eukprot:scaffold116081_cov30-Tisochrysis_lutea.AAC.4
MANLREERWGPATRSQITVGSTTRARVIGQWVHARIPSVMPRCRDIEESGRHIALRRCNVIVGDDDPCGILMAMRWVNLPAWFECLWIAY